jgi:uncharacterized membrane protein (DUF485 family)
MRMDRVPNTQHLYRVAFTRTITYFVSFLFLMLLHSFDKPYLAVCSVPALAVQYAIHRPMVSSC